MKQTRLHLGMDLNDKKETAIAALDDELKYHR